MIKSFVYIILSSVLIFSILAPSVISILTETESFVFLETSEEEKTEKIEKDIEEKILQYSSPTLNASVSLFEANTVFYCLEDHTDHYSKVILPPPEHII